MVRILRSPVAGAGDLHRRMEQMLEQLMQTADRATAALGWVPRADIYETAESIQIALEIPGVDRGDIEILVQGSYLKVSGLRPEPEASGCMRWHQMEVAYGPFERVVALPQEIDPERITAIYRDGFLRITIPRGAANRTVPIDSP